MLKYNFVRPKTVEYGKGVLVIDSDDGLKGDYTHWYPLCLKLDREYSSWTTTQVAKFCPAVVTSHVGGQSQMNYEQLKELHDKGFEVQSHGRNHISIGALPLAESVSNGDTEIIVHAPGTLLLGLGDYEFKIFEGTSEEILDIVNVSEESFYEAPIYLGTPLTKNYTTNARVQLTDESAYDLLQGCIDDLDEQGIDIQHHVYTYHSGGVRHVGGNTFDWIDEYFDSGRGRTSESGINTKGNINWLNLISVLNAQTTIAQMESSLNEISQTDGLLVFYGHGETDDHNMVLLETLIRMALEKGVRVLNKTEAYRYYNN